MSTGMETWLSYKVKEAYPTLHKHIRGICEAKYDEPSRERFYTYEASVMVGMEKYTPDEIFWSTFLNKKIDSEEKKKWTKDLEERIMNNEHLHTLWML